MSISVFSGKECSLCGPLRSLEIKNPIVSTALSRCQ